LSYFSNQPKLLKPGIWFEAALAALDGGTPAGPYSLAPLDYENTKFHVSKEKVSGTEARCVSFGKPKTTLCIDPVSGHLLTADDDLGSFEYSNYTTLGSNSYPQTVKVSSVWTGYEGDDYFYKHGVAYPSSLKAVSVKTPTEAAQLIVTRGEKFPESLFVAPENSNTVDFASCADVATNFTPPRLVKSVKAKRPEAARKAHSYGWMWVLATVSKDGSVQQTAVLSSDPMLSTGATSAVQGYKYTPYLRCGQAAEFQQVFVVAFPLPGQPVYTQHNP
jgi:Gram-negative bacterial TonB protein C-terminal